jgi:histidine triad (HIT) family protein
VLVQGQHCQAELPPFDACLSEEQHKEVFMENCIFCKVAAGQIPSSIVYQDEDIVAFNDIAPQAPHHILLISRRHISSMADLTPADGTLLAKIFTTAQNVSHDLGLEQGYRFLTNVGTDGGQTVQHLHFHLLGGRKLGWPPYPPT